MYRAILHSSFGNPATIVDNHSRPVILRLYFSIDLPFSNEERLVTANPSHFSALIY